MSRVLAKRYVAVIRGRAFGGEGKRVHTATEVGTQKQATFRAAKRLAGVAYDVGTTVTLRAGSKRGGIIERVVMEERGEYGYRWRQAFET